MKFLIALLSAIVTTFIWRKYAAYDPKKLGVLCLIFWGVSLMWFLDVLSRISQGGSFFPSETSALLSEAALGLATVALCVILWLSIRYMGKSDSSTPASTGKKK